MTSRPQDTPATGAADVPAPRTESTPVPEWVHALTTARLAAGTSLETLSARTRVRQSVLRDLEQGRLASSGGTVYARGHLRSVAQVLGVDPGTLLAPFDVATGAPPPVVDPPHLPVEASPLPVRSGPRWGLALVAALAVLAGLLVLGSLRSGSDDAAPEVTPVAAPAPSAAAARPRATTAPRTMTPAATRLGLRAVGGASWVRVTGAGGTLFEGVLAAGQPLRQFSAAGPLTLRVGNAGALAVTCAGTGHGPLGAQGAVGSFTCGATGLRTV